MASTAVQFLGFFLGILGCAGAIAAALLPYRRSTAYVGANFITASSCMMGLWRPVWNSTSLCQTTDHGWTCSYCGASWCPPAWPRSNSEGYKEYVLRPGLIGEVAAGAVRHHLLGTGILCPVTVAWTTKDIIALRKHFPHGVIKYEMGPVLCLGYMSAYLRLMGGLEQQKWQVTRPHPQAIVIFKYTHSRSPPYKPAEALRDNHAPSLCSFSRSSFRLTEYF